MRTLYKRTSSGKVQQWSINVESSTITVTHGQQGGKMQTDTDIIKVGKNIGKANETTAAEQASLEAQAKYEKQMKKGYVTSPSDAKAGKVDKTVITGGAAPMLAQSYAKHAEKISFPAYVQKKLDGCRCIAVIKNGKASLWTRTRKPINSMPHIVAALEHSFRGHTVTLDGELYAHSFHNNFEGLMKLVRPDAPVPGHEAVQHHCYDVIMPGTFKERLAWLVQNHPSSNPLIFVQTYTVADEDDLMLKHDDFVAEGYEGLMVRNADSKYEEGKRSYGLQKVKEFLDSEFPIVGVEEGRGKMTGKAIFVCKAKNGETFNVKMEGSMDNLAKYLTNKKLWTGKKLTVKYQNLTKYGIPRFPVGKAVRDYE
jgi:ATP-dependent DNA ligase